MELAVYDTYVKRADGLATVHFDILVPMDRFEDEEVIAFGREYLKTKDVQTEPLDAAECRFCFVNNSTDEMTQSIKDKGYFILPFEDIPSVLPSSPTRKQLIEHLRAKNESMRFLNFSSYSLEDIERFVDL